mgnify:CR=1 FL=1
MGAQWLDFVDLLEPCGHQVFIKNRNHPNLVNCNRSPAKLVFYHLRPLDFGIESPMEFFFFFCFSRRDPGPHFILFYLNLCQKTRFWDTLKNLAGAKIASKINKVAQKQPESIRNASARHIVFKDLFRNASWVPFL